MTDERGWERSQNKEEGFVRGAALTKRSVAKRKGNSGIFKAKLKCEKKQSVVWKGLYHLHRWRNHIYKVLRNHPLSSAIRAGEQPVCKCRR